MIITNGIYPWFLYFNLCLSEMLDILSCSFTSISFFLLIRLTSGKPWFSSFLVSSNPPSIFASQGLRFESPFSPPLADLEYILRIRALIFHWLRLPVHVSNQKTFYTEHMLSTKCKQRWHRNALI